MFGEVSLTYQQKWSLELSICGKGPIFGCVSERQAKYAYQLGCPSAHQFLRENIASLQKQKKPMSIGKEQYGINEVRMEYERSV